MKQGSPATRVGSLRMLYSTWRKLHEAASHLVHCRLDGVAANTAMFLSQLQLD